MLKKPRIVSALPLILLVAIAAATALWGVVSSQAASQTPRSPQRAGSAVATAPGTGTLQKMIVESGSVRIDLDLNGFNGNKLPRGKTCHTPIRGRSQLVLSHSCVQRSVARS